MKFSFTLLCVCLFTLAHSQLLKWSPEFITEQSSDVSITCDATLGNQGLLGVDTGDVYVHIGVITSVSSGSGDWQHVQSTWGTTGAAIHAVSLGGNKWKYTLRGNLRTYFQVTNANEKILKIAILFRNGNGSKVLRNSDGTDMYVPVYDGSLQVRINTPYRKPTYIPVAEPVTYSVGNPVAISAVASESASLQVRFNDTLVATATGTTISASPRADGGTNQIIVSVTSGSVTKYDTISFYVNAPVITGPLPAGVRDGINYGSDGTSVTLVLYAPYKTRAAVIGEFNNWTRSDGYDMYRTPDGARYWIRLTGLTSGKEYAYQYVVDDTLKVADMFAEKILDPDNDRYIDAETYPNLKAYPAGQTGIVSVLQTGKTAYTWQVPNFTRPDKRNLVIYELLVRDFVAKHNWKTIQDTLSYLKRLGVNAIEVMPFSEFEANISWGYNPSFYFAPDKYYGTDVAVKQFIDECHRQGIAVIMDMVLNQANGSSPTVQLYWDPVNNRPAANNPWHNISSPHPFTPPLSSDFNHEQPATQELVQRVVEHWLLNYKLDGFRWDLSKGFTQKQSSDDSQFRVYDTGRIATWKRIYDTMQQTVQGSYCILEHFADNTEETELSNYGMMLWGNLNYNYNQATMGYNDGSDFSWGIYTNRNWPNPNLVTYMESHDEERLMFKNEQYGNSSGSYSVKNLATGLARNEMAAALWALQPGPKMVWQFGELGYDYSINACEDGTINNECRTSPKAIRWDYQSNPDRAALYSVYSRLFALRNYASYLPAFTAPKDSIQWNFSSDIKWEKITSAPLDIVVIGNFGVISRAGSVTFPHTGVWYDYLNGTTLTVTNALYSFSFEPGEYHVYLDQNAGAVLPLQLISFDAGKNANAIVLNWTTANESNLGSFTVERSFTGRDFTDIGSVKATNTARHSYTFSDAEAAAVNASGTVYYRLKMTENNGAASYSVIARIEPGAGRNAVVIYPNPVKNGVVMIRTNTAVTGTVQVIVSDASGRNCATQTLQANGSTTLPVTVSSLSNGVYHIRVIAGGQSLVNQKLVIQR